MTDVGGKKGIYNLCEKLGKSNKATYAVVAIACAKGIFRPLFTMSDKHENPDTKKYTAIREGLTEIVAIPTYLGVAKLAEKIAGGIKGLSKEKAALAKHNANFLGVCIAAVFVIPALTSAIINPLMKGIKHIGSGKNKSIQEVPKTLDIRENSGSEPEESQVGTIKGLTTMPYHRVSMSNFMPFKGYGTKVGGLW